MRKAILYLPALAVAAAILVTASYASAQTLDLFDSLRATLQRLGGQLAAVSMGGLGTASPLIPNQTSNSRLTPTPVVPSNAGCASTSLPTGTAGQTVYCDGTRWVADDSFRNFGGIVQLTRSVLPEWRFQDQYSYGGSGNWSFGTDGFRFFGAANNEDFSEGRVWMDVSRQDMDINSINLRTAEWGTIGLDTGQGGTIRLTGDRVLIPDGKVGIGVSDPGFPLQLIKDDGVSAGEHILAFFGRTPLGETSVVTGYKANGNAVTGSFIRAGSSGGGSFSVGTRGVADAIFITNEGRVGVGITNPAERLDLGAGNIKMGYETVYQMAQGTTATISCPAEKYAIGGGCSLDGIDPKLYENRPLGIPGAAHGWSCSGNTMDASSSRISVYAICVNIR